LPASGRALATVERGCYWHYNLVACRYASTAIHENHCLQELHSIFAFSFILGSLTMAAFSTRPRHCRELQSRANYSYCSSTNKSIWG